MTLDRVNVFQIDKHKVTIGRKKQPENEKYKDRLITLVQTEHENKRSAFMQTLGIVNSPVNLAFNYCCNKGKEDFHFLVHHKFA